MDNSAVIFASIASLAAVALYVLVQEPLKRWQTRKYAEWRKKRWEENKAHKAHRTCRNICGRLTNAATKAIAAHPGAKNVFSARFDRDGMFWSMRVEKDVSADRLPKVGGKKDPALPILRVTMVPNNLAKARFCVWDNSHALRPAIEGELDLSTEESVVQFLGSLREHVANMVVQYA